MFFHITCQSCWSSAISSGLVVSSRAPRRGRENTVVELELLLIYLKYWPDLPYWNISSRGRGKGMPEPAPSGKQRKQRCQMRPKSGKHPIETRRGGRGGGGRQGGGIAVKKYNWWVGKETTTNLTKYLAEVLCQAASQHLWDAAFLYAVDFECSLVGFARFY